jgi:hypothetical protein
MTANWAPDFGRSPYPSAGEKIGPAWRLAWEALADGKPQVRRDLAAAVALASECSPKTVENLLAEATRKGLLLISSRTPGNPARGGRVPLLVRADVYYDANPEMRPADWKRPAPPKGVTP